MTSFDGTHLQSQEANQFLLDYTNYCIHLVLGIMLNSSKDERTMMHVGAEYSS
jgi:hypothetical protein